MHIPQKDFLDRIERYSKANSDVMLFTQEEIIELAHKAERVIQSCGGNFFDKFDDLLYEESFYLGQRHLKNI